MKPIFHFASFPLTALAALAQSAPATPPAPPVHLEEFVVTGSPLGRAPDEVVQPTSVVAGERLVQLRQATLGETLANEPGISSTYFGPGASRPIIRGLGGDRIRVLSGGIGTLDASVISPDHAVSLDPLLIDRIEIVRGPATLLYGGSAIGGVVNIIDSRIPEEQPLAAIGGRFEGRAGSAADERAAAGVLTGRAGPLAWRLDGFKRQSGDIDLPGFPATEAVRAQRDPLLDGGAAHGVLPNSATETAGAGAGLSHFGARGHLGVSYSGFGSLYGVPGEEDVPIRIDLRQRRWDLHGELLDPTAWLRVAKLQLGAGDYRHRELEGEEVGTRFSNRAFEGRLELLHQKVGVLEGALGLQSSRSDFEAVGEEAFVPPSVTTNHALFLYEEIPAARVTWQLGARAERQKIVPAAGRGLASRTHEGASFSGGAIWKLSDAYALALSATRSARAPNAQELFADGPHAGTGGFEIGDAALANERSVGFDLSLRKRTGFLTGSATVFANRFAGYIFEEDTGAVDADSGLPVFRFVQRDAGFAGAEFEVIAHLHEASGRKLDLRVTGDYVRGEDRSTAQPLPRLTPARVGWALDYRNERLTLTVEMRQTRRARRLAPNETPTAGHVLAHAFAAWRFKLGAADAELFARASNLGDETARVHTSFLKDTAPLPGRDVTAGVRVAF